MAKGQNHSSREAKKPKTSKKKHDVPAYLAADSVPTPKAVPAPAPTKH